MTALQQLLNALKESSTIYGERHTCDGIIITVYDLDGLTIYTFNNDCKLIKRVRHG